MIRDVTLYTVSCNLACNLGRGWDLFFNGEFLLVAQQKYYKTSCQRDVTLSNGYKMLCCVAAIVVKSST